MCTYVTSTIAMAGSAAAPDGEWFALQRGIVYFDHPQDAPVDHALCIDFRGDGLQRVAVELDAEAARRLATSILEMLDSDEVRALRS